jgi:hypothetical protein
MEHGAPGCARARGGRSGGCGESSSFLCLHPLLKLDQDLPHPGLWYIIAVEPGSEWFTGLNFAYRFTFAQDYHPSLAADQ